MLTGNKNFGRPVKREEKICNRPCNLKKSATPTKELIDKSYDKSYDKSIDKSIDNKKVMVN